MEIKLKGNKVKRLQSEQTTLRKGPRTRFSYYHLLAITDVIVKSVLAMIDSLGISVGMIEIGVTTGCQPLSFDEYKMVPMLGCCYERKKKQKDKQ